MKIAIASGKGGTGKTTIATSLAYVAGARGAAVAYLDCDVEEPNGHLFLRPLIVREEPVTRLVPTVDMERCAHCAACARACRFNAIACVGSRTLVFPELCHSCGGCLLACPTEAIREVPRSIGVLRVGTSGVIQFVDGALSVGEAMSPPLIRAVKGAAPEAEFVIVDCPPGTSCPALESVRGCDLLVLVTEPTPFGLHDLQLAVEMARAMGLPFGVVVNRADIGDQGVWNYCERQQITVMAEFPEDRAVAEAYAQGALVAQEVPRMVACLERLWEAMEAGVVS